MGLVILFITRIIFWSDFIPTGLVDGNDVTQSPTILFVPKDDDAKINCSHTMELSYIHMYWYRQLPGEGMKQVLYITTNNKPEYSGGFSEDKISANKTEVQSGSFTVKKLETGDSGMYFCAVSQHSDTEDKYSCTKTPVSVVIGYNIIQIDEGLIMYCRGTSNSTSNNV
uniref:Ig-like domain-containing protein n=1 Tax=Esox lucius TaxID=8010 RepID=A0A6Q2Y6R9_ESOLU